jgi:hypothetical protein
LININIYMSNPETYYKVGGIDLSGIFQPLSLGTPFSTQTGYKVGGNDLNTIFAAYTSGTKAITTGYTIPVYGDLNNVFAKYTIPNQISLSVSSFSGIYTSGVNGSITWYKFVLSGTTTASGLVSFTSSIGNPNCQINFCLIGGGDAGGGNLDGTQFYLGGGGGGIYYLTNVTINTSLTFTLNVGQPGLCQSSPPYRIQSPTSSIFSRIIPPPSYIASAASGATQGNGNYNGGNGGNNNGGTNPINGSASGFQTLIGNFIGPDGNTYTLGGGGGSSASGQFWRSGLAGNGIGGIGGGTAIFDEYGQDASDNPNNFGGGGGGSNGGTQGLGTPGDGGKGAVFLWWNTIQ